MSCSSRTFASARMPTAGDRCADMFAASAAMRTTLNVKLLRIFRSLHDETEPCRCILSHEFVDDAIRDDLIRDLHAQEASCSRVERRLPQHFGHHFAEALEAGDFRVRAPVAVQLQ